MPSMSRFTKRERASRGESGRIVVGYPSTFAYSGLPRWSARSATSSRSSRSSFASSRLSSRSRRYATEASTSASCVHRSGSRASAPSSCVRSRSWPRFRAVILSRRARCSARAPREGAVRHVPARSRTAYFDQLVRALQRRGLHAADRAGGAAARHREPRGGRSRRCAPAVVDPQIRRSGIVLRPLVGSPRTDLLVAWMTHNRSTVLRELLDVVRRYASR